MLMDQNTLVLERWIVRKSGEKNQNILLFKLKSLFVSAKM
jgi:hypothetical protein